MSEIWKPIPSAPRWLASSRGRVCLPVQQIKMPNGGYKRLSVAPTFGQFCAKKRRFKQSVRGRTRWVAPLVCEAFHGARPAPAMQCMHLDENSENNAASNLAWGTKTENHHAPKYLRKRRECQRRIWLERKERRSCLEH